MGFEDSQKAFKRAELKSQANLLHLGRSHLKGIAPARALESWAERVPALERKVRAELDVIGLRSTVAASAFLADQGEYVPGLGVSNTKAFSGVVFGDRPLSRVLLAPGRAYQAAIDNGASAFLAEQKARESIDRLMRTIASDTARGAMGAAVTIRPGVGYVRMTTAPSCPDCIILAGRFYRWNEGFQRHPKCDCKHLPTTAKDFAGAVERGLVHDPYELFDSLSEDEQDRLFGFGNAQAIRDGADIFQVVNSKRARRGDFTLEGLGKHGHARKLHPGLARYGRLTPEAIYARAESREQAVRWLRKGGYILDAGQVPTGAIRGQRLGFGEHGHGGKWLGGRNAEIIRALNSGVRDPGEIGTMTAAEQRMFVASRDLELVRQGIHPYSETALVMRGAPRIGGAELELTPEVAARFERHYYITMHAQGEALEMKRLQRLVPGKPLSAVDTAEVYAHHAARKVVVAERSVQARAAREAIEETKRTATGSPKPLAGGKGGGVKPPVSRPVGGSADDEFKKPETFEELRQTYGRETRALGEITQHPTANPDAHELRTAEILRKHGVDVHFREIVYKQGVKNPDVEMLGEVWEFKAPKGSSSSTIDNLIRKASRQAANLVLDLHRTPLPVEDALAMLLSSLKSRTGIRKVILVDSRENLYFFALER